MLYTQWGATWNTLEISVCVPWTTSLQSSYSTIVDPWYCKIIYIYIYIPFLLMLQWPMEGDDKFLLIYIIHHLYIMNDNSHTPYCILYIIQTYHLFWVLKVAMNKNCRHHWWNYGQAKLECISTNVREQFNPNFALGGVGQLGEIPHASIRSLVWVVVGTVWEEGS